MAVSVALDYKIDFNIIYDKKISIEMNSFTTRDKEPSMELEKMKAYNNRYDRVLALFENDKITFDQLKELISIINQ